MPFALASNHTIVTDPSALTGKLRLDFARTFAGLDRGLTVGSIMAHPLQTCDYDQSISAVLATPNLMGFSDIPVRRDSGIVGLLQDRSPSSCLVRERMLPLERVRLVESQASLLDFLPKMRTQPVWLVLIGTEIAGIVTPADLLKLPVRALAFTLATHLEMVMADFIRTQYDNDLWLEFLSAGRQDKVQNKYKSLKNPELDLDLLECTDFCDKRKLVKRALSKDKGRFDKELKKVEELRDAISHAGTFVRSRNQLTQFIDQIEFAKYWIERLVGEVDGD